MYFSTLLSRVVTDRQTLVSLSLGVCNLANCGFNSDLGRGLHFLVLLSLQFNCPLSPEFM